MTIRDLDKRNFHERFHVDSRGRKWKFMQTDKLHYSPAWGNKWNVNKLVWICESCGGKQPVEFTNLIHDEVTVPDPTEQLDEHDCDVERVRQVLED